MVSIATIGYEGATMKAFLGALEDAGVALLVDVRARASSRRPGFSKTPLAAHLHEAGIEYLHLRGLGTPPDGRAAARSGRHDDLREIYLEHLATPGAQAELAVLAELVQSERRLCLMCFEADPAHCHRSMITDALASLLPVQITNLFPVSEPD
ncbi:MAG: DUF488 domain-containing protein [Gemmatimonadaceae bacterium]